MADRRRWALRNATRAGSVTALLLPLLATGAAAADPPLSVTGPAATAASVGAPTLVPGASVSGMEASEVVRVLVGVGSGTLSVPATAGGVTVPAGYPTLGTEGPELALEGGQDALNAALAQLRWTPATAGPAPITIDASPAGAGYDPANGHFYQVATPPQGLGWDDAKAAAAGVRFQDQAGYLATITDAREESTVAAATQGPAWIGGHRQQGSHTWTWATGPEAGSTFWTPACGVGAQGTCSATDPATYANWAPSEPRSLAGATVTTFLGGSGGGLWAPSDKSATPANYVIEFGGTPGDGTAETAHADATMTATEASGIGPVTPGPNATPVRSTPPTTAPTTTTPTTEPPTTTAAPPVTEAPAATEPATTTPPATTAIVPPPVTITPTTETATTATATPDAAATTAAPTADTAAATAITAPSALPVYIVFDVGVGTPAADVKITVRGYGLQVGSVVTVAAHSRTAVLAAAPVDANGTVTTDVLLPADLGDGEHTVVADAIGADGTNYERVTQFAIAGGLLSRIGPPVGDATSRTTSPPTTVGTTAVASPAADTGATSSSSGGLPVPLIVALLAAVVGAIVWLVSRRRKAGPAAGRPSPATPGGSSDRMRSGPPAPIDEHVDQFR